mmetsp:Transcript_5375/g.8578  ORF Transcript_5375/g.8578 Transcript_5375/m.8578 type:complete len:252 (+) Transcript_5375:1-756(+)
MEAGVGPKYYGRFKNGRIEGFLEGYRTLEPQDLRDTTIGNRIAVEMARMHKAIPAEGEAVMWKQLQDFLQQAKAASFKEGSAEAKQFSEIDLKWVEDEIEELRPLLKPSFGKVFCHNDLLAGNIMEDPSSGKLQLIDFEYGGTNFRGFDMANHFNEWAGGTDNGYPDYTKVPSEDQMRTWIAKYLDAAGENMSELQAVLDEVKVFLPLNHIFWSLWAVNMADAEGCQEFPYLTYTQNRLGQFKVCKSALAP